MKGIAMILCLSALVPSVSDADALAGKRKAEKCVTCHVAKEGTQFVPVLDGQTRDYFIAQIRAFQARRRTDWAMLTNASSLTERDVRDLADFFAARKPPAYPIHDAKRAERGRGKLQALSCSSCHGINYYGEGRVPRLAGQSPKYIAWTLRMIKAGSRLHPTGEAASHLMLLTEDEIDDLANCFASME